MPTLSNEEDHRLSTMRTVAFGQTKECKRIEMTWMGYASTLITTVRWHWAKATRVTAGARLSWVSAELQELSAEFLACQRQAQTTKNFAKVRLELQRLAQARRFCNNAEVLRLSVHVPAGRSNLIKHTRPKNAGLNY